MNKLYHGPAQEALAELDDASVDVAFLDKPYNIKKAKSSLPKYDKSQSIIDQRWKDFSAGWDVIHDYWEFTRSVLGPLRRVLKPTGSGFLTGTFHNIPILHLVLKELDYHVVQWIAWCKPNSFPNRELEQMTSANEVVIWVRPNKKTKHMYNVERARDYGLLDYVRTHDCLPMEQDKDRNWKVKRPNLRDFWPINNDSRAVKTFPFLKGHGAKKPPELVARCIDIALPEDGGVVLDPFFGTGTTGYVCDWMNDWIIRPRAVRPSWIGVELYAEYIRMCESRLLRDSIKLSGAQQLSEEDRADLRLALGDWAEPILDGRISGKMVIELAEINNRIYNLNKRYGITIPKVLKTYLQEGDHGLLHRSGRNQDSHALGQAACSSTGGVAVCE